MRSRKLTLKKERLSELSGGDLRKVVGGSHACLTLPPDDCLSLQECPESHQPICLVPTGFDTCAC